ncbi:MAG: hypothetical protein NHF97_01680, partial [Flavobacteriia bacterium]|nr:hypothetical protein [Candidatus Bostrichicola ureolyticus]
TVIYRVGSFFEKKIYNYNYGLTFGMELPIKYKIYLNESYSSFNVNCTLGNNGKENYVNFIFGFTFNENWVNKL